jgi:hypothetical protein
MQITAGVLFILHGASILLPGALWIIGGIFIEPWLQWKTIILGLVLSISGVAVLVGAILIQKKKIWIMSIVGTLIGSISILYLWVEESETSFLLILIPGLLAILLSFLHERQFQK